MTIVNILALFNICEGKGKENVLNIDYPCLPFTSYIDF